MRIALNDGTDLALGVKTGMLTRVHRGGLRTMVESPAQLRGLLAPLGQDAITVHLDHLSAWCSIALDRDSSVGIKATRQTRAQWQTSARLIAGALALGEQREAA